MQAIELAAASGSRIAARFFAPAHSPRRALIDCCENAPRELHRIAPSDVDAKRIGHFGFFCAHLEATLWTRVTGLFPQFSTAGALA